jgi:hypothetical protein
MFGRKRSKAPRDLAPIVRLSLERLEARETPSTLQTLSQPSVGTIDLLHGGTAFSLSAHGRYVAFEEDGIRVLDRTTGTTSRIDTGIDGGLPNGRSESPSISADGRFVAFRSWASNLVPNDTNERADVFLYDRQTGSTILASVGPDGKQLDKQLNTWGADGPSISGDGRFVTFVMGGSVRPAPAQPWDPFPHPYLFDRLAGTASLIDVGATGMESPISISADCRFIAMTGIFNTSSSGWALYALETGTIRLPDGLPAVYLGIGTPSMSADGRYVALLGASASPSGRTVYSVYVYDVQTEEYSRISAPSDYLGPPTISAGGRYIAFAAADDSVPGYSGSRTDVFIYDRQTNTYTLVSDGIDGDSGYAVISPDGQLVAFQGSSSLSWFPGFPAHQSFLYTWDKPADIAEATMVAQDTSAPRPPFGPMLAFTIPRSGATASMIAWDLTGDGTADFVILTRRVHQRLNVTAFDMTTRKAVFHFGLTRPRQMPQFFSALVHLNRDSLLGLLSAAKPRPVEPFGLFSTELLLARA